MQPTPEQVSNTVDDFQSGAAVCERLADTFAESRTMLPEIPERDQVERRLDAEEKILRLAASILSRSAGDLKRSLEAMFAGKVAELRGGPPIAVPLTIAKLHKDG
jgi:hypothetical protein